MARSFATPPTAIIFNLGTNDGTTSTVSQMTALLNKAIAATTGPIMVLRPFNGTSQAANLQAAIAACSNPSQCFYLDTTGVLNPTYGIDSLSLHPSGPNNLGKVAPALLTLIRPLIAPNAGAYPAATTAASSDMAVVVASGQTRAISITNLKAAVAASS